MNLESILAKTGLQVTGTRRVGGGDINEAYCLFTADANYFLKVNDAQRYPEMFAKEAQGLQALKKGSTLYVPQAIKFGEAGNQQYLLLEWIEQSKPANDFWEQFGTALAVMHRQPQLYFGFEADNYIGSLPQNNQRHDNWPGFYAQCRIMPLVKQLNDSKSLSAQDVACAEQFCNRLPEIFPEETPSLLHADLWSGNYMTGPHGQPAMIDPAVYYGHREMDLGMTLLFGGFAAEFYEAYQHACPLESRWRQRVRYTQLYPLLVHAILFGGHYVGSVREILKHF